MRARATTCRATRSAATLAVAAWLAAAAGCGPPPPPPHAIAVASAAAHDFGPLWIGEVRQHTFTVENRGGKQLVLDPVRSSCGCLVARLAKNRLAPGEATEMVAELHADKGPARLDKAISIGTNDPAAPLLMFALSTDTRMLYEFAPPLVDLPELVIGQPFALKLPLRVADGSVVRFGVPHSSVKGFTATMAETDATTNATVELRFDGTAAPGRRLFQVTIPTDHPRVGEARIPVQAIVNARLRSVPDDRLDFGTVKRSAGAVREIVVSVRGSATLAEVPKVEVEAWPGRRLPGAPAAEASATVTAQLETITAGREWRIEARVAPGTEGTGIVGRLIVTISATDEPPLTLSLGGQLVD